jgi:hypothetical protein
MFRARRAPIARAVVRTAATTAVVAGTAGAVRHHQDQKWANQNVQQEAAEQQMYDAQQQAYQQGLTDAQSQQRQAAPPPQAMPATDLNSQLMQLAQLRNAGVLTDEEFAAAKAKLLAA